MDCNRIFLVLDFCRTRIMMTDTQTNFSTLQLTWAARSSCIQRAGRTGRTSHGRCYRFVKKSFYEVKHIFQVYLNQIY